MEYTCRLEPNGTGGFIVRFDDVPEVLTEGDTRQEALTNAEDALEVALLGRMKDGDDFPVPAATKGDAIVAVSAQVAVKLAFYLAFKEAGMSRLALARKLGKDEAEIRRMLDPHHATKLPALEDALRALGKRLSVKLEAA